MKNFTAREGRTVQEGTKVRVYRNLHNGKWSIKVNGLVVGYADEITLKDVTFTVSEKGRAKVLKEKKKYVHAYAVGTLTKDAETVPANEISYNPYKAGHFYDKATETAVHEAKTITLSYGKMYN